MDPVKILPTEVFEQILSHLSLKELMSCCLVSQQWYMATNNDALWKEFCLQNEWLDCGSLEEQMNCSRFLAMNEKYVFHNMVSWKRHYVLKNRLQNNWRNGNSRDIFVSPISGDFYGDITEVSTDGHSILAFGFDNGVLRLYDFKDEAKLIATEECVLVSPVTNIHILDKCIFVMQNCVFQAYKINGDFNLELFCIKIIKGSLVTNVDIPTLMLLDRNDRSIVLHDNVTDEYTVYHFNENYLVFASLYSHIIKVFDLSLELVEPDFVFDLDTELADSFIFSLYASFDVLYVLVGEFQNMWIQAYSLRSKTLLFDQNITENEITFASRACSFESNELYLIIRFNFNTFILIKRDTGNVLLKDAGIIFLNANSNPRLVGIFVDDSFQILDPNTGSECYCITLEGLPLAVHSNVIATMCVEFNRDCVASTEIEFWNMHDAMHVIDSLKFPKTSKVLLLYKDNTKLIFYASRECCCIRSFLV